MIEQITWPSAGQVIEVDRGLSLRSEWTFARELRYSRPSQFSVLLVAMVAHLTVGLSSCQCHCLILKSDPNIPIVEDTEMEEDYGFLLRFNRTCGSSADHGNVVPLQSQRNCLSPTFDCSRNGMQGYVVGVTASSLIYVFTAFVNSVMSVIASTANALNKNPGQIEQ